MNEKPLPKLPQLPEKCCLITLMVEPKTDAEALLIKEAIDKVLGNTKILRYSFNIEQKGKPPQEKE